MRKRIELNKISNSNEHKKKFRYIDDYYFMRKIKENSN